MDIKTRENLFNLECCVNNLYNTCLSYYKLLSEKESPFIKNITCIMDLLINYKKTEKERTYEENVKVYDEIHNLAYKNIQEIFEYDKKQDEEKGIKIEPQKLQVGYRPEIYENKDDKKDQLEMD